MTKMELKETIKRIMKEEKIQNSKFRRPYYEISDNINILELAAKQEYDADLLNLVKKLKGIHNAIYKHLDNIYNWD